MSEIVLPRLAFDPAALGDTIADIYAPEDELSTLLASDAGVTPDMLLLIAESRLRDMDSQIELLMGAMEDKTAAAARVSSELDLLRDALGAMGTHYGSTGAISGDPDTLLVTFRGESMSVTDLSYRLIELGLEPSEATSINRRENLDNLIEGANEDLRDINAGNEMSMIRLQSAMQNRTTIISATTNLMKTIDEGNDAVVANLR